MIRRLKIYPSIDELRIGQTDQVTFVSYRWDKGIKNKLEKDLKKYYRDNDDGILIALEAIGFSEFRISRGWLLKDKKLTMEYHDSPDFARVVAQLEPVEVFIRVNARGTVSVKDPVRYIAPQPKHHYKED